MYRNLSEFIARLEREGELQRVSVPVDPVYEIAEITDRMSKQPDGGKALLFEQTGTPFPVLTNMMGSDRRMAAHRATPPPPAARPADIRPATTRYAAASATSRPAKAASAIYPGANFSA